VTKKTTRSVQGQDDEESAKRRGKAIERIVNEAAPLNAEQIVKLRRIFARTTPPRQSAT